MTNWCRIVVYLLRLEGHEFFVSKSNVSNTS